MHSVQSASRGLRSTVHKHRPHRRLTSRALDTRKRYQCIYLRITPHIHTLQGRSGRMTRGKPVYTPTPPYTPLLHTPPLPRHYHGMTRMQRPARADKPAQPPRRRLWREMGAPFPPNPAHFPRFVVFLHQIQPPARAQCHRSDHAAWQGAPSLSARPPDPWRCKAPFPRQPCVH